MRDAVYETLETAIPFASYRSAVPEETEREKVRKEYKDELLSPKNGTMRVCRRCFVNDYFHEHLLVDKCLIIDPLDHGGSVDIHLSMKDHLGKVYCNDSVVSVRTVPDPEVLNRCNDVAPDVFKKSVDCRSTSGDYGKMVAMGRVYRGGEKEAKVHRPEEDDDKQELRDKLRKVCIDLSVQAQQIFPQQVAAMRHIEQLYERVPDYPLGGEEGISSSAAWSMDLGGSSHMDTNDASIGIVFWHEQIPKAARHWYFFMPNVTVERESDEPYEGVAIKISHGTAIAFDGRDIRHCTTITVVGEGNHTHGIFFGVKEKAVVTKLRSIDGGVLSPQLVGKRKHQGC
jgi:hypothetical protein